LSGRPADRGADRIELPDEAATRAYGRRLAAELRPDGTLLLYGEMGAGKTVLTQGVAEGLGLDPRQVQSPTFTLVHEYHAEGVCLFHVDLVRLEPHRVSALGLEETLAGPGVKVIEWAERLPFDVAGALRVSLAPRREGGRTAHESRA
jgi:tRNA threonylcarbamoyladenosine biosynthesis protein TsaE